MAIIVKKNSGVGDFEKLEAGTYVGRCVQMIHIGTVKETIGKDEKRLNKIRITWETPTELRVFNEEKGEQPYLFSKDYTMSMSEKGNLRKMLEAWRGEKFTEEQAEAFDITVLLGVPCMLSIQHNQKGYAEISGVSKPMKGVPIPAQITPSKELNYDNFDYTFFETLPEFIKEKMKTSEEFKAMVGVVSEPTPQEQHTDPFHPDNEPTTDTEDDGLPF